MNLSSCLDQARCTLEKQAWNPIAAGRSALGWMARGGRAATSVKPSLTRTILGSKPALVAGSVIGTGAVTVPTAFSVANLNADAWKAREAQKISDTAAGQALHESRQGWNRLSGLLPDASFLEKLRSKGHGGVAKAYEGEEAYRKSEAAYQSGQTSGSGHWNREKELWNRHGDKLDPGWMTRAYMNFKHPKV